MYGGMAQGFGQALLEGMAYTPEGQPLTGSLMDYAIPRAGALPQVSLETMETPSPFTRGMSAQQAIGGSSRSSPRTWPGYNGWIYVMRFVQTGS